MTIEAAHPGAIRVGTSGWTYDDREGRRLHDCDDSDGEMLGWCGRVEPHLRNRSPYAFFDNDWHANAPRDAARFRELLESRSSGDASASGA